MNDMLTPCTGCQRHIRENEGACPFCGALRTAARAGASVLLIAGAFVASSCVRPPADRVPDAGITTVVDGGNVALADAGASGAAGVDAGRVDAGVDASNVDAGSADAGTVVQKRLRKGVDPKGPDDVKRRRTYRERTYPPYGAPPARGRLV